MNYQINITPAINIVDRHELEEKLRAMGYTVTGSGGFVDGSGCDISITKE